MQTSPKRKAILVVDDNFSVLTVIKSMLETDDYDVLTARSAEVAISIAEKKGGKSSGPRTFSPMAMKRLSSNDDVTIASPDSHSQNLCFEARRQVRI